MFVGEAIASVGKERLIIGATESLRSTTLILVVISALLPKLSVAIASAVTIPAVVAV
jgi:hypothetical protein